LNERALRRGELMNKKKYLVIVGVVAAVVALSILFSTMPTNHRPVITSLEADQDVIIPSGGCQIVCKATDPDSDELSYGWSASGGGITGEGANVTWTAPSSPGSYNITVIVMDSRGSAVTDTDYVTVTSQKAPDFTLPTLTGTTVTLSKLEGAPVVLAFGATHCYWCREQAPYLEHVAQQTEGEMIIIDIDVGENITTVQDFFSYEPTMTVALDSSRATFIDYCEAYNNTRHAMPFTLFVDSEGVVRFAQEGWFATEAALWDALHSVFGTTIP
jgi:thiol-disulfide isomerase/thioredoxin